MRTSVKVLIGIFLFIFAIGIIGALSEGSEREPTTATSTEAPAQPTRPSQPTAPPSRFPNCEDLGPDIIELSKENSAQGATHILKLYEIAEVSRTEDRLDCSAVALTSRNSRQSIVFYALVDEDGDSFIGLKGGAMVEPTPEPTAELPDGTYGPGMYKVGTDILPGTYKGVVPQDSNCYWERLTAPSGDDTIIANDFVSAGQFYVNIAPTDAFFNLKTCTITRVE